MSEKKIIESVILILLKLSVHSHQAKVKTKQRQYQRTVSLLLKVIGNQTKIEFLVKSRFYISVKIIAQESVKERGFYRHLLF